MLEVVAMADKAYTQVLKDFPDILTGSSATVALICTLAKAHEKHTTAVLEGIEISHENWVQLKIQWANTESRLLTCTCQLYDHLLSEAAHLFPSAFSNVLNLSMGVLPPIQHTMPLMQPTIVLATQAPTLGVLPPMGINFGVVDSAGDGGSNDDDAGGDGVQETEDDVPGDPDARHGEGGEEEGSEDHDHDVILVSSSPCKVTRQSVTPLSTSDRDIEAGPSSGSMATGSARAGGGSEAGSLHLFSPDRLKMTAQLLIWSTHALLDHPNKSLQKTADPSDDEATLEHTASFDNEGQMTSLQEDDLEEDNVDSLIDPGDSATQAEREVAVAKIRPSVWAQDAADVKRIKQKQMPLGRVSESLIFNLFNPKQILEDILNLIVSRLSTDVFIDCHTTAPYQPNLDLPHIKHMYLKFKYAYVIQLCCISVDILVPQLFTGVFTSHTIKKHTIPRVMAKSQGGQDQIQGV